jgi:uncharacterized protein YpmB
MSECRHEEIAHNGICLHCGVRAAIMIPLEKREPRGVERAALADFERACDDAIAALGEENAYRILSQRKERAKIIARMAPKEKLFTRGAEQVRGVSQEEATARDARERMEEEQHVADIKAMNKAMGL